MKYVIPILPSLIFRIPLLHVNVALFIGQLVVFIALTTVTESLEGCAKSLRSSKVAQPLKTVATPSSVAASFALPLV